MGPDFSANPLRTLAPPAMDRVTLDYTGVTAAAIGVQHGLSDDALSALEAPLSKGLAAVQARRSEDLRWLDLPLSLIHISEPTRPY